MKNLYNFLAKNFKQSFTFTRFSLSKFSLSKSILDIATSESNYISSRNVKNKKSYRAIWFSLSKASVLFISIFLFSFKMISNIIVSYITNNQSSIRMVAAPTFSYFKFLICKNFRKYQDYILLNCLFIFFIVYIFNSLVVTSEYSLAITLLSNKTLICPRLKYYHIFIRGVKGITPRNGSTSKLPPISEKGRNNEDIPANNAGQGKKLPLSEITKNMGNETFHGSTNPSSEKAKTFHEPQLPLLQNKFTTENSEGSTSSFDNIKKSNIDYEKTRNKELQGEKEQRKQSLLAFGTSNNNNSKMVERYEYEENPVEWPTLPKSQEAYEEVPPNFQENLKKEMEKYCDNKKEDKICEQINKNQIHKKELEDMAKNFNIDTKTISSDTYSRENQSSLTSTIETQRLLDQINQIPRLKALMEIKPSSIREINPELLHTFNSLRKIIINEIQGNLAKYQELVYKTDPYPNDGLDFYHHTAKAEWHLLDNKKVLSKIKEILKEDNILDSQLLHIGEKLTNVKYNDVDYKNLVENLFFSKKKSADVKMARKFLKNQLPLEDEIIIETKPSINKEEVLQRLNQNDFYISYIDTKDKKYKSMFIEHGANSHMCLSISYQGKRLILGYLTSSDWGSEIAKEQLYEKNKPQNFTYFKNLCVEDENLMIDLEDYKQYCENPQIKEILINEFSKRLDTTLNNPVTEVPTMTKPRFKKILINKIDEEISQIDSGLNRFKDPYVKEKGDLHNLKTQLEAYQNSLNNEGAKVITWYKEIITVIEDLEEKKRKEDYELYRSSNPKGKKKQIEEL